MKMRMMGGVQRRAKFDSGDLFFWFLDHIISYHLELPPTLIVRVFDLH